MLSLSQKSQQGANNQSWGYSGTRTYFLTRSRIFADASATEKVRHLPLPAARRNFYNTVSHTRPFSTCDVGGLAWRLFKFRNSWKPAFISGIAPAAGIRR